MLFTLSHILSVILLANSCWAGQPHVSPITTIIYPVHQFPNGTWVENIAIRKNGPALVTLASAPEVHQVDTTGKSKPILVHRFTNATSVLGITELENDVFAVVIGTIDSSTGSSIPVNGSFSIHRVDLRHFPLKPAKVSIIAALPTAVFLNGLTSVSPSSLLVSDSSLGVVFHVNATSHSYSTAFDLPSMKPVAGASIGVNGIRTYKNNLYYTNSYDSSFWRVNFLVQSNGKVEPKGDAEKLPFLGLGDDFAIDTNGNAYVAGFSGNSIEKVQVEGEGSVPRSAVIARDDILLAGDTSAALGRTKGDQTVLYVGTSEGRVSAVYGARSIEV